VRESREQEKGFLNLLQEKGGRLKIEEAGNELAFQAVTRNGMAINVRRFLGREIENINGGASRGEKLVTADENNLIPLKEKNSSLRDRLGGRRGMIKRGSLSGRVTIKVRRSAGEREAIKSSM